MRVHLAHSISELFNEFPEQSSSRKGPSFPLLAGLAEVLSNHAGRECHDAGKQARGPLWMIYFVNF